MVSGYEACERYRSEEQQRQLHAFIALELIEAFLANMREVPS